MVGLVLAILAISIVSSLRPSDLSKSDTKDRGEHATESLALSDRLTRSFFRRDGTDIMAKSLLHLDLGEINQHDAAEPEFGGGQFTHPEQLTPPTEFAGLPPAGQSPWVSAPSDHALMSIIIDDIGPSWHNSMRAVGLGYPLTMAFLPYAEGLESLVERARLNRHEIMLHLPMQPLGNADPGPNALLSDLEAAEFERRLQWSFDRIGDFVGVNNHMGSRLTSQFDPMARVMSAIKKRGLFFVDSRTSSASVADEMAAAAGLRHTVRDVFLDNDPVIESVIAQLDLAARIARRRGSAIAIGHPYPETIKALDFWLPQAVLKGITLVPVSELIAFRDCIENGGVECFKLAALRQD